jgi:hypothetical protein
VKIYRVARWVILAASLFSIVLLFLKPAPVATPQAPALVAASAQSFQEKLGQLEQAREHGQSGAEVRLNSDEVSAAMNQAAGTVPDVAPVAVSTTTASAPDATAPSSANPTIKEQQIAFDGDTVRGQFLTEVAGKDVYVTVAGHLGSRDGYVTFEPTDFKVGDLSVPVSLVNSALQKKLEAERDRLKLPEFIDDVRIENGELVIREK